MLTYAGTPGSGADEVQTITFSGTITGGTFTLTFQSGQTAPITWSAVNATLIAAIDAALEALPNVGAGQVTTAVGTMTAGIGTATVTFTGTLAKKDVGLMTAGISLTGTGVGLAIATTTPGSAPGGIGAPKGALLSDTTNGILYIQTGTSASPTWTKVGTQT
jgi:hypothetical protein